MALVSWMPVRHLALILNLMMNRKQVAPVLLGACSASFLKESCDSDAEDDLHSRTEDNPGTIRATKLCVVHRFVVDNSVGLTMVSESFSATGLSVPSEHLEISQGSS